MARNLRSGLRQSLNAGLAGGFASNDIFTTASLDLNFAKYKNLGSLVTFSRASSGTYVGSDGLIKTATTDAPRFDHDPTTGESLGLLVEEQRTNLITDSSLTTIGAGIGATISSTTETNPEGIDFCRRLLSDAGTNPGGHRVSVLASSVNNITVSAFVKKDTHRYVYIGFGGGANSFTALFDIDPTVTGDRLLGQGGTGTYTNIDAGYQNFPNGWVRIWAAGTTSGAGGTTIGFSPNDSTFNITDWNAAGTEAIFIHGVQYEDDVTFPTSYIPTYGIAATRSADVSTSTSGFGNSWYRQDEGTVFAHFDTQIWNSSTNFPKVFTLGDGPNENIWIGGDGTTDDVYRYRVRSGGVNYFGPANIARTKSSDNKAAIALSSNSALSVDGATAITGSSVTVPSVTNLTIGADEGSSFNLHNGTIRRLCYWPQRLPDSTLSTITQ